MRPLEASASLTPRIDLVALDGLFNVKGRRVFVPGGYGALWRGDLLGLRQARSGRRSRGTIRY